MQREQKSVIRTICNFAYLSGLRVLFWSNYQELHLFQGVCLLLECYVKILAGFFPNFLTKDSERKNKKTKTVVGLN